MEGISELQRRLAKEDPELLRLLEAAARYMKRKDEELDIKKFIDAWVNAEIKKP